MFLLIRRMRENRKVSIAKGQRQNGRQAAKPVTYLPNLMKKSHLVLTICLLTVVPTIAQERQRFFDNFDTARGVQVYRPEFVPVGARSKPSARLSKNQKNKKLIQKTVESLPVQKTVQSRMNVTEGLADREMPRAEYNKLRMSTGTQLKGFTTGDLLIDSYIVDSSRRYGIDPLLIYSQMHQESSFKLRATSNKGASGLMQLMPGTARRLGVDQYLRSEAEYRGRRQIYANAARYVWRRRKSRTRGLQRRRRGP